VVGEAGVGMRGVVRIDTGRHWSTVGENEPSSSSPSGKDSSVSLSAGY
jgi:hypothetical protein